MYHSTGGKSWWIDHLQALEFQVNENKIGAYLEIVGKKPPSAPRWSPEKDLKNELVDSGLLALGVWREERVKLGQDTKKIDLLNTIQDVTWVIECKIPNKTDRVRLDVRQVGQAIGQVLILTYLAKTHFRENLSDKFMPAICTWTLGTGSTAVKDICRMVGVTIIEILEVAPQVGDIPTEWRNGRTIRIYYLDDMSPRPFCEDWREG